LLYRGFFSTLTVERQMTQTWNAQDYGKNASFVPGLAGGVLEWLGAAAGEQILDLGCGDGQLTQRIAATGASVAGVDLSAEMLGAARSRGIDAREGSAESLPFAERSFDAVFSNAVLHWIRDQDAMMAEVHRVLKQGGRFVAEMGGHGNSRPFVSPSGLCWSVTASPITRRA
jgi:SAM-dependent methyltransferase